MTLPHVAASTGKHAAPWTRLALQGQSLAYQANGGFPVSTGRRRINPFEHFSYTVVRSTK